METIKRKFYSPKAVFRSNETTSNKTIYLVSIRIDNYTEYGSFFTKKVALSHHKWLRKYGKSSIMKISIWPHSKPYFEELRKQNGIGIK